MSLDFLKTLPEGHYVYIIQDVSVTQMVKIGHTNNPYRRLSRFEVKLPFETKLLRLIPTSDAVTLEGQLHRKYAAKRHRGEWFDLNSAELTELLNTDGAISVPGIILPSLSQKAIDNAMPDLSIDPRIYKAIWFLFIGLAVTFYWLVLAWFFFAIIIGIPLARRMVNYVPRILYLGEKRHQNTRSRIRVNKSWFFLMGWWLGAMWLILGYFFAITIVGMPVAFQIFDATPRVITGED